jgi:predicted helicase
LATSSKFFDGDKKFSHRLWISTTNNWNTEAETTIKNQDPPVSRIGLQQLEDAAVDWEKLDAGITGDNAVVNTRKILQHQLDAINAAQEHFKNHERGKLIMACGTGKTFTSLKIAEKLFPRGKILFLVPSISLLSQTLAEWATFAELPLDSICVCSDETASRGRAEDSTQNIDLALPATTDAEEIARRLKLQNSKTGLKVVFSTYQSLEKVSAAQKIWNENFDLIICDEAHRTTGYGKDATAFTAVHDNNFIAAKKRLYMTTTPRLYTSDAKKKAVDKDLMLWSMDDAEIYGDEFFYIGFGEAVEKNLLSDYKVIVLAVTENNIPAALQNVISNNNEINFGDYAKIIGSINALSKKVLIGSEDLAKVDPAPMKKAVAFCSKIKTSKTVCEAFNKVKPTDKNLVVSSAKHVDGTISATERNEILKWLKDTPPDGRDCRILTNARCLSEGVDVPSLDAVLFLASKKSRGC